MKGDFSQWENKKIKETINFRSVLHQQGKILTDYDWNTQSKLDDEWQDNAAGDILGRGVAAIPAEIPEAFKVKSAIVSGSIVKVGITQGRAWINGLLTYLAADHDEIADRNATYLDLSDIVPPPSVKNLRDGIRDAIICEVYREEINGFQLPEYLIEPALGGPDTTERVNTAMEFKLLRLNKDDTCDSIAKRLRDDDSKKGKLIVSLTHTTVVTNDCNCPTITDGGYTGFEHRLCRIEIAKINKTSTTPMFKYSSFNGGLVGRGIFDSVKNKVIISSNRQAIESSGQKSFYLEVIRYDNSLGNWIVTFGDTAILTEDGAELILSGSPLLGSVPSNTDDVFFRLWDEIRKIEEFVTDPSVLLKDGIHLLFEDPAKKNYIPGDYWTFSVRAGGLSNLETLVNNESPHGIQYYRVPLGILKWNDPLDISESEIEDCREIFKPITDTLALYYVSGDGQEASPGTKLPFPLIVGVAKANNTPVSNIPISFTITQGNGTVENGKSMMTVLTGEDGLAACTWTLGIGMVDQQVRAEMLNENGTAVHVPVLFNAKSEINQGNCTIVVHPGDDIKSLIDNELPSLGGKVCFSAGTFVLKETVQIDNRNDILFEGTGSATRIIINNAETAFLFSNCNRIHVNQIYIQSTSPTSGESSKPFIKGVLTFMNCSQVKVTNSTLICNRRFVHTQSCLMFHNKETSPGSQIEISTCTFHVGSMQDGILLVNTRNVIINNNFIDLVPAKVKPTFALNKSLVFKNNPMYRDFVFALGKVGKQVALAKKVLNTSAMVKKSLERTIYLQKSGKPIEALAEYKKALEIHDKTGNLFEKAMSNNIPTAIRPIFKKVDTTHKAITSSLGNVISTVPIVVPDTAHLTSTSLSDTSLAILEKAHVAYVNITKSLTQGVSQLSSVRNAGKQVSLAKKVLNTSTMMKKSLERTISLQKSGKPIEALAEYKKALEIHDKTGNLFEKAMSNNIPTAIRPIFKKVDTTHKAITSSLGNVMSIPASHEFSPAETHPVLTDISEHLPDSSIKVFEGALDKYDKITSSLVEGVTLLSDKNKNEIKKELTLNRNVLFSAISGDIYNPALSPNIAKFVNAVNNDLAVGYQGIVFGGSSGDNLMISNNTIKGMIQGIHIGASISDPKKQITKFIKEVSVHGNKIELKIPMWYSGQKHGVLVGNADVTRITNNDVFVERINNTRLMHSKLVTVAPVIGIQAFGVQGKMTILSGNMISNTDTGIRFCTVNFLPQHDSKRSLRLITQNVVYGSQRNYDPSGSKDSGSIKYSNHDNIPE